MDSAKRHILVINGGSSSIKFAIYDAGETLAPLLQGETESSGSDRTRLTARNGNTGEKFSVEFRVRDKNDEINQLAGWLIKREEAGPIKAIGHRIVHGMKHASPELISPGLLDEFRQISVFDPEHLPDEIKLIETMAGSFPGASQFACFDTSFHQEMPVVAKMLPIPRRYLAKGIQHYGFHGISCSYLLEELARLRGEEIKKLKIILAHLGNGASVTAVREGKSVDTSMGFTPTGGIPMGARTGDLDPGVAWYLVETEKLGPAEFSHLINHESGMLGISETSSDMRILLDLQEADNRAAEAIDLFCYQVRKWIGAYAAVLGGVDILVFSGGIGENAAEVRMRICKELGFLGIELDQEYNRQNHPIISSANSRTRVYVIRTNEELMIAKMVSSLMAYSCNYQM